MLRCSLASLFASGVCGRGGSCGHLPCPVVGDKSLQGRSGQAALCALVMLLLHSLPHGLCFPRLRVQHVARWQALVNRWGVWMPLLRDLEEKQTPSEWLCMKPSAYQGRKPTERTRSVCPCYQSWRLKSSEGHGMNHKFKARAPLCAERLFQELMLISLPLLQTSATNPCEFCLLSSFFFFS